jgi:hypothetical protein
LTGAPDEVDQSPKRHGQRSHPQIPRV